MGGMEEMEEMEEMGEIVTVVVAVIRISKEATYIYTRKKEFLRYYQV